MVESILSCIFIFCAIGLVVYMFTASVKENEKSRKLREKELEFFEKHSK